VNAARCLRDLPKVHLHLHLDGSFPAAAVAAVAARNGADLGGPGPFASVWEFFDAYLTVPAALRRLDDLAELCAALARSEATQGVVYAEPGVEPDLYPHLGDETTVLRTMVEAFADAGTEHGIEVGTMVVVNTDTGAERAQAAAERAAAFAGAGVTAFGLACFDEPDDWGQYAPAVDIARSAGLKVACHAGQTAGADSVRRCLDALRPDRIAHGVRAAEDPDLLTRLAGDGVVLDICPTSNVRLGIFAGYAEHPFPRIVAAGVPVSLNADDEYWFASSVSDEYELARRVFALDDTALARVAAGATEATAMSAATRRQLHDGVAAWLAAEPQTPIPSPTNSHPPTPA
jgi:adenosine deaminase